MAKVSIIDWIVKKLKRCIAIVEDGDTASQAIASGKYVIWKGNAYKASTAISQGDTLSLSNLTAVSDGIGNELNSKLNPESLTVTVKSGFTVESWGYIKALKIGKIVILAISGVTSSNTISSETNLCEIAGIQASDYMIGIIRAGNSGANGMLTAAKNSNTININNVTAGNMCFGQLIFPIK